MTGSRLAALLDQATPGPWDWPHNNALAGDYARGYDSRWSLVAAIHDAGPVSSADARLIALAPDLARLLVDMADHMKWLRNWVSTDLDTPKTDALLARFAALDEKAGAA